MRKKSNFFVGILPLLLVCIGLFSIFQLMQIGMQPVYGKSDANLSGNAAKADDAAFTFVTLSDAQDNGGVLPATANQALALNPNFGIFVGDLEDNGFSQTMMNLETAALGGLYPKMWFVRGNHDDETPNSDGLWENYFSNANRPLSAGISNYTALNPSSTYLNYSFDYGNSRFIGLDVPGDADLLTPPELSFLDARLTDAESIGLVHAFIFFHGPPYCTEKTHCDCTEKSNSSCTPNSFISIINKHPIVDATFNGHEHLLAWTHMDRSRVINLTHPYEQFLTAPSATGNYNDIYYPSRVDYIDTQNAMAFGSVSVNGASFTVNFYRVGTATPVWSKTFTKSLTPTPTSTTNPSGSHLLFLPYVGNTTSTSVPGYAAYSQGMGYDPEADATSQKIDGRVWYSAQITGLSANTSYPYQIFNNGGDLIPRSAITFTTGPGTNVTSFKFDVVGDNQPESASATPYPAALAIASLMDLQNPDLVLHSGDMIFDGFLCTGSTSAYSQYTRNYFDVYQALLGKVPFFTAIGNHEVQTGGCGYQAYKDVFDLPQNAPASHTEEYYSFDWGNAHFVSLDTNSNIKYDLTQRSWLINDLQNTSQPWKIVFLHLPAYSSGDNGSDPDVQTYLVPIFEAYGVNVVFNGHDHDYERTCPILDDVCKTAQAGGIVYYTNGGGGAYTQPIKTPSWFTAYTPLHETNEFLDVSVKDCKLQINAIDKTGSVMDGFEYNHCSSPTPTSTPTSTPLMTDTPTPTATSTAASTSTATSMPTVTSTSTATSMPSPTSTSVPATNTSTATGTATGTATPTNTATATRTPSPTLTRTATLTATFTSTPTVTRTMTLTPTLQRTATPNFTRTSTPRSRSAVFLPIIIN